MTAIIVGFALGFITGVLSAGFLGLYIAMTGTAHDYWDVADQGVRPFAREIQYPAKSPD